MAHHYMGDYEVVSHTETPECSLRLLRLTKDKYVRLHHHHKTTQTYFVLDGSIQAAVGSKSVTLQPHQSLRIPTDVLHSIQTDKEALVLSTLFPRLRRTTSTWLRNGRCYHRAMAANYLMAPASGGADQCKASYPLGENRQAVKLFLTFV